MGMPVLKFNLAAVFCTATLLLLGCAFNSQAADETPKAADTSGAKAADAPAAKATDAPAAKVADAPAKKPADASAKVAEDKPGDWSSKSGAALWAQDCRQCHNIRSPSTLSSAQWENAMAQMRFRCNLTAKEYRKVAAFLKAASSH